MPRPAAMLDTDLQDGRPTVPRGILLWAPASWVLLVAVPAGIYAAMGEEHPGAAFAGLCVLSVASLGTAFVAHHVARRVYGQLAGDPDNLTVLALVSTGAFWFCWVLMVGNACGPDGCHPLPAPYIWFAPLGLAGGAYFRLLRPPGGRVGGGPWALTTAIGVVVSMAVATALRTDRFVSLYAVAYDAAFGTICGLPAALIAVPIAALRRRRPGPDSAAGMPDYDDHAGPR